MFLILFSEYAKLIDSKDKKTKIKYTINSKQQVHSCLLKKEKETELEKFKNSNEEHDFALRLIKDNIDNNMNFYYENLKNNKIYWPKKKIERIV